MQGGKEGDTLGNAVRNKVLKFYQSHMRKCFLPPPELGQTPNLLFVLNELERNIIHKVHAFYKCGT